MLEAGSFEEYLRPVAAGVSPGLISPSAFSDISSVARVLPSTLAYNTFGFECRLGEELPRADFLVLATSSCGRDSLAGLHPTSTLPARLMADPVWRRVRDFAARWAEPSSPLYHAVDNVWLEFDIDGPVSRRTHPERLLRPTDECPDGRSTRRTKRGPIPGYRRDGDTASLRRRTAATNARDVILLLSRALAG